MFTPQQPRTRAGELRELQRRARTLTELAENEGSLANDLDKTVHRTDKDDGDDKRMLAPAAKGSYAEDEEQVLRCLGAAVIMQWNNLPTKLQKELFDNASSMDYVLQAGAVKGQIARFLHNHKDDDPAPKA
jgi:hypothetical protein